MADVLPAATAGYSANGGNLGHAHRHLVNCYVTGCRLPVHDCAVYSGSTTRHAALVQAEAIRVALEDEG